MKSLTQHINEKLVLNSNSKIKKHPVYKFQPESTKELKQLVRRLIEERGNDADLNDIDTSLITNMDSLFQGITTLANVDISQWDVSNVTSMDGMFFNKKNFNCDLSEWDVSNVENMESMFMDCDNFTGKGLKQWNTGKVKNMSYMFTECFKFAEDISGWNVSSCENFIHAFSGITEFNQPVGKWDISKAKQLSFMFLGCEKFNQDLSNWKFSQYLDKTVSLFNGCKSFEGKGLDKWVMPKFISDCSKMFAKCENLKEENIKNLDFSNASFTRGMFLETKISTAIINKILNIKD
jgi:surface protein